MVMVIVLFKYLIYSSYRYIIPSQNVQIFTFSKTLCIIVFSGKHLLQHIIYLQWHLVCNSIQWFMINSSVKFIVEVTIKVFYMNLSLNS